MSKAESEFSATEEICVQEGNVRDKGVEPLETPPRVDAPRWGATTGSRPNFQVYGHAASSVQLRDAHTMEPLSGVGVTNKYGEYVLPVNRNLPTGVNDIILALWKDGSWTMDTLITRIYVVPGKESDDTNEGEFETSVPGAGRENQEDRNTVMYTRPFFRGTYQGMKVERRPTFGVGGHARSWLRIIDSHTGIELTNHVKTDQYGDTDLRLNDDLKQGVHDLHVYLDGHDGYDWYMRSNTLRVVVLDPPVITHSSMSSMIRGQNGVPGADIVLAQAGVGSFHGKGIAKLDGSWEIQATGLHPEMMLTARQHFSKVKYVENTFSGWAYNVPVTA